MTIDDTIAAYESMYLDASKNKSIYEGLKNDYMNLNNSLGSYSNHVNSALDFIFGAGSDCENGGFISGTQILGGDLIYDIQGDLEKSLESLRELNTFCLTKIQEYEQKVYYYQLRMTSYSITINNLKSRKRKWK